MSNVVTAADGVWVQKGRDASFASGAWRRRSETRSASSQRTGRQIPCLQNIMVFARRRTTLVLALLAALVLGTAVVAEGEKAAPLLVSTAIFSCTCAAVLQLSTGSGEYNLRLRC